MQPFYILRTYARRMQQDESHFLKLAKACAANDPLAQRALYEHFKGKMFGVCLRYAQSRQDAEDYLHDGFITVFRDIHQYQGKGSLEGWIRRVIVHTTLKNIKKQKMVDLFPEHIVFDREIPENEYDFFKDEAVTTLALQLMQGMPTGFRTVLNLYILEGFSHAEIAAELQISEGTSKSQLNRAKAHLRQLLEKKLTQS